MRESFAATALDVAMLNPATPFADWAAARLQSTARATPGGRRRV